MSSKERSMHDPGHLQGEYVQHGLHIMQSMQSSSFKAVQASKATYMLKHKSATPSMQTLILLDKSVEC